MKDKLSKIFRTLCNSTEEDKDPAELGAIEDEDNLKKNRNGKTTNPGQGAGLFSSQPSAQEEQEEQEEYKPDNLLARPKNH